MAKITVMNLFQKQVEKKEGGKYDTYFMAFPNHNVTISTKLSNDVKAKLQLSGIKFPMTISLSPEDYFITKEEYTDKDGVERIKSVCVITNYQTVEKLEMVSTSLDDYLQQQIDEKNDLPF